MIGDAPWWRTNYWPNYCPNCAPRCPCCGRPYYTPPYTVTWGSLNTMAGVQQSTAGEQQGGTMNSGCCGGAH